MTRPLTAQHTDMTMRHAMVLPARQMRPMTRSAARSSAHPRSRVWHSHRVVRPQALGFDFGEQPEPERRTRKKFQTLGTVAASMLVLGPLTRNGAVAEAFFACLAATQKMQASNKDILAAYSKFYGLLLSAGYDSWQDYLLDQLLLGRDNPVARAAAQGSIEEGAPVLRALAHDLDLLQLLSVSVRELSEYVGEVAPFGGQEWVSAGSALSFQRSMRGLGNGQAPRVSGIDIGAHSQYIGQPPTPDELNQWKDAISSKDYWSQAMPVVLQFWHEHGFGITSRNTTLRWVKGALEEAPDNRPPAAGAPATAASLLLAAAPTAASLTPTSNLSCLEDARSRLALNTQRHCDGQSASHVLLAGPSGSGKTWLLWDSTISAGRERGLRIVDLNGADGNNILEAARGCGRYPRIRFVLVADHVDLPLRGSSATDFMAALSNVGPGGWPSNTLLYLGVTATSTVPRRDPFVSRFGASLFTSALTEDSFKVTLTELMRSRTGGQEPSPEQVKRAVEWCQGEYSVRAAAQFVDLETIA